MNYMISFEKKNIKQQNLPDETGIFLFSNKSKILYVGRSANLRISISRLLQPGEDDKDIFKLVSLTTEISYLSTADLFSALIEEKILLQKYSPEFNDFIKPFEHYVYLAVDFYNVPFLQIKENTSEEFHYLGPFQNRFFIYDLIDIMAATFQYPACENEKFPCYRLKEKSCYGWCLKDKGEIAEILLKSYLTPNNDLVLHLEKEIDKLLDELEFSKTEKQKQKLETLKKYNDMLTFFHITKKLNLEFSRSGGTIKIENGMLAEISENGKYHNFVVFDPEYRENEFLAHDKSQLAERWIIYHHLKKNKLEQINVILKKSFRDFDKIFEIKD